MPMSEDGGSVVERDFLSARVCDEIARERGRVLEPGLYVVATPIGNLGDITLRALVILSQADVIFAEDTRHSVRLMSHYGISKPMRAYHDHSGERERGKIVAALERGQRVALISDAGTPLISDPGFKLVREISAQGFRVVSLPGPSAMLAGLSSSGLPTDTILFAGFLPNKGGARRSRILELKDVRATLIFFEAPSRVFDLVSDLREVLGEREGVVARELTKLHEEIVRGSLADLVERFDGANVKGECVVLVGPPAVAEVSEDEIVAELSGVLDDMSLRDGARHVALSLGVSKARVYQLGLKLKNAKT